MLLIIIIIIVLNVASVYRRNYYEKVIKDRKNDYLNLIKSIVQNEIYTNHKSLTMIPNDRLENIRILLEIIIKNHIKGDIVECGTWRGGAMAYARSVLNVHNEKERLVHLFDTFTGFPCLPNSEYVYEREWCKDKRMNDNSLENVKKSFLKMNLLDGVKFYKGLFNNTIKDELFSRIALLRLDADSYENTLFLLNKLYNKIELNGFIIIDDYSDWKSCKSAVTFYRDKYKISEKIQLMKSGAAYWKKI